MDHLTYPFGIEPSEEDAIMYVSFNDYRGVPFLEYVKTNKAYQVAANMQDGMLMAIYGSKSETSELERFLQTWLFFGLLQEVLGELFDQDDFVRAVNTKVVISTKLLPGKLRQWMSDPSLGQKRLTHLQQCLRMTMIALISTPKIFDTKLKVGIAATAEVICTALLLAAEARNISTKLLRVDGWGELDETSVRVEEMQKQHGWCPVQASSTLGKFYSLQAKIYLSKLTRPGKQRAHAECSLQNCRDLQIDPSKYKSLHRHPGTCPDVKANQVEVVKALKDGKSALLDLKLDQTSNEISVTIKPAESNSWYIALSHVWADGLGNTKVNSLPQCQLRHLYNLLTRFCIEDFTEKGQKRPYLWLDTLCCPVDPEHKLLALAKMPEVYREASQVLVLDSTLTDIDCKHLQPIEIMSRVFTSGWIFRLWTLNEANLASKLRIQFRDGVIDLGQISSDLSPMTQPETYHFTSELHNENEKLCIESSSEQGGGELWLLTEALRYRSVSEVSDEPICVAALLRMRVDVITGGEKVQLSAKDEDRMRVRDERMARLWESSAKGHPKIPKTLIHHVGDRLMKKGLRWAPSTLLKIKNTSPFLCSTETDLAFPSANGLIVSSSACSISVPQRVDNILNRPSPNASIVLDVLKYDENRWLTIFSTSEQKKYPSGCDHLALYDIIIDAGRGAEFEMLTERVLDLSQEPFDHMNCLLVLNATKESQTPEPGIRNVRFYRQASLTSHGQVTCDFLTLLLTEAQALQSDSISQDIRESSQYGDQDPRYVEAFKRLQEKVESVVDKLEVGLDATGTQLPESGIGLMSERRKSIFALLSRFYRNRYLVKERDFPITQQYCVD